MPYLDEVDGVKAGSVWQRISTGKRHKVASIYEYATDRIVIRTRAVKSDGGRGGMFSPIQFLAKFMGR